MRESVCVCVRERRGVEEGERESVAVPRLCAGATPSHLRKGNSAPLACSVPWSTSFPSLGGGAVGASLLPNFTVVFCSETNPLSSQVPECF